MIRNLEFKDRAEFINMATEFCGSNAVLHSIPVEYMERTFSEIMSNSPYAKCHIIEHDSETAGYGLISITYSNEVGSLVVFIEELFIKERFRGHGLGGKYLDFIHDMYSGTVRRFRLEISKNNTDAERLYLRKGYEEFDYKQMVRGL